MLLASTMIVNSELIIRIFLGSQWLNVNTLFIIIALALIFNIDGRLADCYLRSLGFTKDQFFFRVAETVAKILGVLAGVYWGVTGVAVGIFLADAIMKTIKICYVSAKLKMTIQDTFKEILNGWQFLLIVLPIILPLYLLLPHTVIGNIIMAVAFAFTVFSLFILAPKIVGKRYADQAYPAMKNVVLNRLKLKR